MENKQYSVWVKFDRIQARNVNEAIEKVINTMDSHLPIEFQNFYALRDLMKDFYPEEKIN